MMLMGKTAHNGGECMAGASAELAAQGRGSLIPIRHQINTELRPIESPLREKLFDGSALTVFSIAGRATFVLRKEKS